MSEDLVFILFLLVPFLTGGLLSFFFRRHKAARTQAGWGWLIVGNTLLLTFLLSLLFVAGEIYYRYIYDTTDALSYTKVSQSWFRRYFVKNSADFRDNVEYSLTIEPGKRRVSFLGDSFTAGHGVSDVEDRFANLIRRSHPEYEVQVLATLGNDTGAEIALIQSCAKEGCEIDQVVLVYCLNDVADILPEWKANLPKIFADVNRGGWLRRNSYLVDTFYHRYKAMNNPYLKDYFNFVRRGYEGEIWELQQRRLTELRDLVEAGGGRLSVVTFPFLHLRSYDEFRPAHQKLDAFWKRLGVPHLDLLPVFEGMPPEKITVNRFDSHPNELAHALAAEKLDQFLTNQFKTNSPKVTGH